MDEFELYIDVSESDVIIENKVSDAGYYYRIRFCDEESVKRICDLMERLKIYSKYHDR